MIDSLKLNSKKSGQSSEGVLALYMWISIDFQCLTSSVYPPTLTSWKHIMGSSNSGPPNSSHAIISGVSVSYFLSFLALPGSQKALAFVLNEAWLLRTQFRDSSLPYDLDAC
ncbi:hypothetical protein N7G274_001231 [Stereocaulon virgatum]|uniref:Uncharacterized protein n=1 Tax=Stereocaulon virgatum TaxID=373712 RepID=A0ABR4ANA0_9LECA